MFTHATSTTIHQDLDPSRLNKAGRNVRESRDSDVSTESLGIGIVFDGTGSMYEHPTLFAKKLAGLMTVLVKDGFVKNPHLLFGQICDYTDTHVLQLGQFEADNKMDTALTSMALLGGGGGSAGSHEAYELILWYMANHVEMDCLEKRGEKGWLFMIGDEMANDYLTPDKVKKVFGLDIPAPVALKDILKDLKEKFHVHWILPSGTMHWDDQKVRSHLRDCYGENVHFLEDPTAICETIAGIIAAHEGFNISQINAAKIGRASCRERVSSPV